LEPRSPRLPHRTSKTKGAPKNLKRNRNTRPKKKNQNRLSHPHKGGPRTLNLILDSNIIVKLVINEGDLKQTKAEIQAAIKKGYVLCTVDFALTECLNVIWKHANLLHDLEDYSATVQDLLAIYDDLTIIPARTITEETINIATTKNISAYDATYIAATQKLGGKLYTTDKKLATTANTITTTKLLKPN
jgi:predicted nucleic acid-binding protein